MKGTDRAKIRTTVTAAGEQQQVYDEINHYTDNRYVGPCEAVHRIHGRPLTGLSHFVQSLCVHLPNQQTVFFQAGEEEAALNRAENRYTTLTGYFHACVLASQGHQFKTDPRTLLYSEMPYHFTFKPTTGWTDRSRNSKVVGRMHTVRPADIERFHLRILLLHVRGPVSFEDLRTFENETSPTFLAAAQRRGLTRNDNTYVETIDECIQFQMPSQLRSLFATLLAFCEIGNPQALWDRFQDALAEDYVSTYGNQANSAAYHEISRQLAQNGLRLSSFVQPLPEPVIVADAEHTTVFIINAIEEKQK